MSTPAQHVLQSSERHIDSARLWQSLMDLEIGERARPGLANLRFGYNAGNGYSSGLQSRQAEPGRANTFAGKP